MKRMCPVLLAGLLAVGGCASDPYGRYGLGEARDVVASCVEAMGGLDRWLNAGPIHAEAVVTLYHDGGAARVNKQQHAYHLGEPALVASARLPGGGWRATVPAGGEPEFRAAGGIAPEVRGLLLKGLATMLHRVNGPLNLLRGRGDERAGRPQRVRVAAMDLIRVPVTGGDADAKAYYFDAQTCLLRLVTVGADAAGEDGTVTLYTWEMRPNGMVFPAALKVMRIGDHVLVGEKPVLEVDFHHVRF